MPPTQFFIKHIEHKFSTYLLLPATIKMIFKSLDKLSQDFTALLNDREDYDIIIEVGENENKTSFTAHSAVLRCRSLYFNKELVNITVQNENNIKTISKPNFSAQSFDIILR